MDNNTKGVTAASDLDIFKGQIREVLTCVGALAFTSFDGWQSVTGLLVAVAVVIWSFAHHSGANMIYTSIRKALALVPAVLVAFDVIDLRQSEHLVALLAPLSAMVWSLIQKEMATAIKK